MTAMWTRRRLLSAGMVGSAAALWPWPLSAASVTGTTGSTRQGPAILVPSAGRWNDTDPVALAARAIDAANAAGATYADVRLTLRDLEEVNAPNEGLTHEVRGVGVRVLANGAWGFFSSAVWTPEEMVRLAQGAVAQAKAHGTVRRREPITLGTIPVATGTWTMPVRYDPFTIPFAEKSDFMVAVLNAAAAERVVSRTVMKMVFARERKIFASSEGSAWTQTIYQSGADFGLEIRPQYSRKFDKSSASIDFLTPAGKGWEYVLESGVADAIPSLIEDAREAREVVPVDIGRFDLVCSAHAMAALAGPTLGEATQLDRALGYEDNAAGTSYLSQPLDMLGTFRVGSPLLTVSANRSVPGGAATVKWDDEGVVPDEFTVIKDGILTDFQTTREQAEWLAPYYAKTGHPVRSHGCASADSALDITLQHLPNLQVAPGSRDIGFDELVASTENGLAVLEITSSDRLTDQQVLNGYEQGLIRQIKKGKLGPFVPNAAFMFRAPELWKSLVALGGARSVRWFGTPFTKGEPEQQVVSSVGAPPGKFTGVAIIDGRSHQ